MLDKLQVTDFQPLRGETFRLGGDPSPDSEGGRRPSLDVLLVEIRPLGDDATGGADAPAGESGRRRPFSLLFRGGTAPLPQGIYRLEHDAFDALELFLVPLGPDDGQMVYEAILG